MKNIVVIDIGSNSVRLILAVVDDEGNFNIINDLKESVRLEEKLYDDGYFDPSGFESLMNTLRVFKGLCDNVDPDDIIIVATESFRRISNLQQVLQSIYEETGFQVRVLSGDEEAYYDYLAAVISIDFTDGLIIDIGGGSTELMLVKDRKLKEKVSLPMGAINLARRFDLQNRISLNQETALKNYLHECYREVPWLSEVGQIPLIGIGGSLRNIGKIDRKRKQYPLEYAHHYSIQAVDIEDIYTLVRISSLMERRRIKGLSKERADIIVGPLASVSVLLETLGIEDIIISGYGLREGLLYDHLIKMGGSFENALNVSINNQIARYNLNKKHAVQVYKLTLSMFRQLESLHQQDPDLEKVLKTAAMLHNLGIGVRYYSQDKHTFDMIMNCGLNGLTHREMLLSAHIAASHYKDDYKIDLNKYPGLLTEADCSRIKKIGILVRIAESLDRSSRGIISDLDCSIYEDKVVINVISSIYPEWEIENTRKCCVQFKRVYNKELLII